jgi:hypothetical protein
MGVSTSVPPEQELLPSFCQLFHIDETPKTQEVAFLHASPQILKSPVDFAYPDTCFQQSLPVKPSTTPGENSFSRNIQGPCNILTTRVQAAAAVPPHQQPQLVTSVIPIGPKREHPVRDQRSGQMTHLKSWPAFRTRTANSETI